MKRFVFDAGPFILLFTREKGSDVARRAVLKHEAGEIEISIHPNNLSEAYRVLSETKKTRPRLLEKDVDPRIVVRSAYATLNVVQDEMTTINLGTLKVKYRDKPWGDLSSAALALRLSDEERIPVVTLDEERHLKDLSEITTIEISDLKM